MADTDHDQEDRTLPPTEKRLRDAREEGRIARSKHLTTLVVVGGAFAGIAAYAPQAVRGFREVVSRSLVISPIDARDAAELPQRLQSATVDSLWVAAPVLGALWLGAAAAPLLQGGFVFTSKPYTPDFERLNPLAGLKRMASLDSLWELGKTLAVAVLVGGAALVALWQLREPAAGLATVPLVAGLGAAGQALSTALWGVVGALAAVALADVAHERHRYQKSLRMTPDEVRREAKEQEGDPHLKARIRQAQRDAARRRMMSAVPKADVVVTNPTHYAVALAYVPGAAGAPRIVALGRGPVALKIREIAEAAGVPRLEAPPLARALYAHGELDREIPVALYQAVAQVLAWVFQLRRHRAGAGPVPAEPHDLAVPDGMDPGAEPAAAH